MFEEFAAALQFPLYFGRNWAAFHDSLQDNRTTGGHNVLFISKAADLLSADEAERINGFFQEMTEFAQEYSSLNPGWKYWTVVLADSGANISLVQKRFA